MVIRVGRLGQQALQRALALAVSEKSQRLSNGRPGQPARGTLQSHVLAVADKLDPGQLARVLDHGITRPHVAAHQNLQVPAEFGVKAPNVVDGRAACGSRGRGADAHGLAVAKLLIARVSQETLYTVES